MAIICRDLKLLYIMVGGTGCSSVGSVLMERFGGTLLPACPLAGIDQKHNSIKQLVEHNLVSPKELKSYFKVANARNPFDRVASQYARLHGTSWEEFLKNPNSWVYKNKNYPDILRKEIEYAREVNFEKWVFKKYGFQSRVKAWLKYYLKGQGFPPGQYHTLFTDVLIDIFVLSILKRILMLFCIRLGCSIGYLFLIVILPLVKRHIRTTTLTSLVN